MTRPVINEACTKTVATVGPASDTTERLAELIEAGVDIFRINTAHGDRQQHEMTLSRIREASQQCDFPVGVLLDLSGPKIRLGQLAVDPLECELGMQLTFVRGDVTGDASELTSTYPRLVDELETGDRVMLADGTVTLTVMHAGPDRAECEVTAAGEVRSRQGINLPGVKLSVDAMLDKDVDNAIWGASQEIDFISLSFVRRASDVYGLRQLLAERNSNAMVIAKIEKPEALEHLEAIVDAADGIMVARGDLGVEIDVAQTPIEQKRIIRLCHDKLKPVIVATQMLESMHHSTRPTRAEVSDVANAILDGTDACMLSGETAVGEHPVSAVQMMNRIMLATEHDMFQQHLTFDATGSSPVTAAVTRAATHMAEAIDAKMIVITTRSGNTAWVNSQSRSRIPTLGASDSRDTLQRMNLYWGIKPVHAQHVDNPSEFRSEICRWAQDRGHLQPGDRVVFVTGTGVLENAHAAIVIHTV